MEKEKVLLVEDSPEVQEIIESMLEHRCALTSVFTIAEAQKAINETSFSLVILDVNLPDGSGFELCKKITNDEKSKEIPVVFLTGQFLIEQKLLGFSSGADDYIVKPFEASEFVARIESKLKRRSRSGMQTAFQKSEFRVDLVGLRIFVSNSGQDEKELNLTPIEFRLFVHFLRNEGKIISRHDLLMAAWGNVVHISAHTLDTHISSLRKKISTTGHRLKAVMKQGYCFSIVGKST